MFFFKKLWNNLKFLFKKEEKINVKPIKTALEYMIMNDTSEEYFSGNYGVNDRNHSGGKSHQEID